MNVVIEIESAYAEDIARRFHDDPGGKKNWILKNKGILVGKQICVYMLHVVALTIFEVDPAAVIRVVKQ